MDPAYNLTMRAWAYAQAFPDWPDSWPYVHDHWLNAVWVVGNNYKSTGNIYGAYPPGYLRRVYSLFPDRERVLHLFSGSLPPEEGAVRCDLVRAADVRGNARDLPFVAGAFDLILADPPYSVEDALKYGTPQVNRRLVLDECARVLAPGGYIVWLDTVRPQYNRARTGLTGVGIICLVRSTMHRIRAATVMYKPNT